MTRLNLPRLLIERTRARQKKNNRAQGDEARDRQDWPTAVRYYHLHLKRKPNDFAIWVQLGHAQKESGQLIDALISYSEAYRLCPTDADLLLNIGHLNNLMGHNEDALEYYRKSSFISGNSDVDSELVRPAP